MADPLLWWCKTDRGDLVEHESTPYEGHHGHVRCVPIDDVVRAGTANEDDEPSVPLPCGVPPASDPGRDLEEAAGPPSPTPGPTPERLFEVLSDALTESGGSHVLGSDVARARNAVMALLSTPATVLCEGNTKTVATSGFERILEDHSWFDCAGGSIILPVPDGTHVVVTRSEP